MNQHERKINELQILGQMWDESEWRLNFLRNISATPFSDQLPEQLEAWKQQISAQRSIYQPPPKLVWN